MEKNIPNHIGLIIDGNRRWAKEKGLSGLEGHLKGSQKLTELAQYIWDMGVKILTVYAFSTENWNRSEEEVNYLMKMMGDYLLDKNIETYHKKGIKILVIGQKERLEKGLQDKIAKTEEKTKNNKNGVLVLAISYGGRAEIIEAIKKIAREKVAEEEINEKMFDDFLWTKGLPHPELIIRSGGEQRLSNFLTWQSAYSELYFSPKFWPDFTCKDIDEAIADYSKRQKRFGR